LELDEVRTAANAQTRERLYRELLFARRISWGAERGIYHAAKHGVIGFTKSAALEYATRGIRVNAVCPGLIWTPMADQMVASGQGDALKGMEKMIPMGRVGRPEEIADAVLYLCSSAASYITCQSISVGGGFVMR
jgi:NAD(P)-dependent dehydrogenase (short-subunit alcohol dehydrogenase family)